jgi:NDP-sugar pyrophosphorylase family protein
MNRVVNALIPMAGQGKRFRRAGYDTYKPFLPIFGKPMIQHVLDAFPAHVVKRVLADRSLLTDDQMAFLEDQPGVIVHSIPSHTLGPAYSILQAREALPLDESFFIAYCDIWWTWNYGEVERLLDSDGVVFTRRQFHPHLVGNSYSAFCRPPSDDPYRLLEIREKAPFTDDWMQEPLSIGAFYVKSGRAMIESIQMLIESDDRVSGEFFPSLLFNHLVKQGRDVRLSDVDFFAHWGVPAQLEDVQRWVSVMNRLSRRTVASAAVNVCCMGGAGVRMQQVSQAPKALMPMPSGDPMFRYVADRFGCESSFFIVNEDMAARLTGYGVRPDQVVDIGPPTESQMATLRDASEFLQRQNDFLLTSCDAFGLWDPAIFAAFLRDERPDAVVFTFDPTLLQSALGGSHTYVQTAGTVVTGVHIKHRPDGNARGLAGFFWFKNGAIFGTLSGIEDESGRELCADHVIKTMVERGQRVGSFPIDEYIHLGSPVELQEFAFWSQYEALFA